MTEFNTAFAEELRHVRKIADQTGNPPDWPDADAIFNMALAMYRRLANPQDNKWTASSKNATFTVRVPWCFNCGKRGHMVKSCTEPLNQEKIAANRAKFRKAKKEAGSNGSTSGNSNPQAHTVRKTREVNGQPQMLNKKGKWVPDTRVLQQCKEVADQIAAIQEQAQQVTDQARTLCVPHGSGESVSQLTTPTMAPTDGSSDSSLPPNSAAARDPQFVALAASMSKLSALCSVAEEPPKKSKKNKKSKSTST